MTRSNGTLTVSNMEQKILLETELFGQISDGAWENSMPYGHHKAWGYCRVLVGDEPGRNFPAGKDNYDFTRSDLLTIVGQRMLNKVRIFKVLGRKCLDVLRHAPDDLADYSWMLEKANDGHDYYETKMLELLEAGVTPEVMAQVENNDELYSMKQMRKDLAELKKAFRNRV